MTDVMAASQPCFDKDLRIEHHQTQQTGQRMNFGRFPGLSAWKTSHEKFVVVSPWTDLTDVLCQHLATIPYSPWIDAVGNVATRTLDTAYEQRTHQGQATARAQHRVQLGQSPHFFRLSCTDPPDWC